MLRIAVPSHRALLTSPAAGASPRTQTRGYTTSRRRSREGAEPTVVCPTPSRSPRGYLILGARVHTIAPAGRARANQASGGQARTTRDKTEHQQAITVDFDVPAAMGRCCAPTVRARNDNSKRNDRREEFPAKVVGETMLIWRWR
jgi:hypothetical protein